MAYSIDPSTIEVDVELGLVSAKLTMMSCTDSGYLAQSLDLSLSFYEDGIMRAAVDTEEQSRFRISQEDLPVVWDQLKPVDDFESKYSLSEDSIHVAGITRGDDTYDYEVVLSPFEIRQMTNG